MGRFNASKYDPANDSSPSSVEHPGVVYIERTAPGAADGETVCHCGCAQTVQSKKSKFRMGHDARFKGVLTRAHLADVKIVLGFADGLATHTAMAVAKLYDNDRFRWTDSLKAAEQAQGDRVRNQLSQRGSLGGGSKGPRPGDKQLIKVGRWEYTAEIVEIDHEHANAKMVYQTAAGERKTVVRPLVGA